MLYFVIQRRYIFKSCKSPRSFRYRGSCFRDGINEDTEDEVKELTEREKNTHHRRFLLMRSSQSKEHHSFLETIEAKARARKSRAILGDYEFGHKSVDNYELEIDLM
jgi:hypothetical protein